MPKIKELRECELEIVAGGVRIRKGRTHEKNCSRKNTNMKKRQYGLVYCPQCNRPKLPYRTCPSCGYYDGKDVIPQE